MSSTYKNGAITESDVIRIPHNPESISELVNPLTFEITCKCGSSPEILEFEKSNLNRGIRVLSTVEFLFSCLVFFSQISLCRETFLDSYLNSAFPRKGHVPFLLTSGIGFYSPIVLFIPASFFTFSVTKWKSQKSRSYKKLVAIAFGLQTLSALLASGIIAFSSLGRLEYLTFDYDYEYSAQETKLVMFYTLEIIASIFVVLSSCSLAGILFPLLILHQPTENSSFCDGVTGNCIIHT